MKREEKNGKTPEYTRKAIKTYQSKHDNINISMEKGTKDRIREKYGQDVSINKYICGLIYNDLEDKQ